jgi:hypothetical protein
MAHEKHWNLEEMAILCEAFPLDGDPPNQWEPEPTAEVAEKLDRSPGAIGAKWYDLSAAQGYREVRGRGGAPIQVTGAGLIRKLARDAARISEENAELKRENAEMKDALEYAARVLHSIETGGE